MDDLISIPEAIVAALRDGAFGYISAQELKYIPSEEPEDPQESEVEE